MLAGLLCNPLVRRWRVRVITPIKHDIAYVQTEWAEINVSVSAERDAA